MPPPVRGRNSLAAHPPGLRLERAPGLRRPDGRAAGPRALGGAAKTSRPDPFLSRAGSAPAQARRLALGPGCCRQARRPYRSPDHIPGGPTGVAALGRQATSARRGLRMGPVRLGGYPATPGGPPTGSALPAASAERPGTAHLVRLCTEAVSLVPRVPRNPPTAQFSQRPAALENFRNLHAVCPARASPTR